MSGLRIRRILKKIWHSTIKRGIYDAIRFDRLFRVIWFLPHVRRVIISSIHFNWTLFLGTYLLFYGIFLPRTGLTRDNLLYHLLSWHFYIFWIIPLYLLSPLENNQYYTQVASELNKTKILERRRKQGDGDNDNGDNGVNGDKESGNNGGIKRSGIIYNIADEIYSKILYLVVIFQMGLIQTFTPIYLSLIINFILSTCLASLTAFEYPQKLNGWNCSKRVEYFHTHPFYFFGFGMIFNLISLYPHHLFYMQVFAILFPFVVILATLANPTRLLIKDSQWPLYNIVYPPNRIPIFTPAIIITDLIIKWLLRFHKKISLQLTTDRIKTDK